MFTSSLYRIPPHDIWFLANLDGFLQGPGLNSSSPAYSNSHKSASSCSTYNSTGVDHWIVVVGLYFTLSVVNLSTRILLRASLFICWYERDIYSVELSQYVCSYVIGSCSQWSPSTTFSTLYWTIAYRVILATALLSSNPPIDVWKLFSYTTWNYGYMKPVLKFCISSTEITWSGDFPI